MFRSAICFVIAFAWFPTPGFAKRSGARVGRVSGTAEPYQGRFPVTNERLRITTFHDGLRGYRTRSVRPPSDARVRSVVRKAGIVEIANAVKVRRNRDGAVAMARLSLDLDQRLVDASSPGAALRLRHGIPKGAVVTVDPVVSLRRVEVRVRWEQGGDKHFVTGVVPLPKGWKYLRGVVNLPAKSSRQRRPSVK